MLQRASCYYVGCPPKHQLEKLCFGMITPVGVSYLSAGQALARKEQKSQWSSCSLVTSFPLGLLGIDTSSSLRCCHLDQHQLCCSGVIQSNTESRNVSWGSHSSNMNHPPQGMCIPVPATSTSSPPSCILSTEVFSEIVTYKNVNLLISLCCFSFLLCYRDQSVLLT